MTLNFDVLQILHLDMDAFFAAVEVLDDPSLEGKPLLVGGSGKRGVVATASYEARKFGCHSAQPMSVALKKCPNAMVVPPRGARYREISDIVFGILGEFTPLVEPVSIDEAFLDIRGTQRLFGPPAQVAREIKERILKETGLTASIGVAPNKFLAKLSSDLEKPDGLTVMDRRFFEERFPKLPIAKIWGLGRVTLRRFEKIGVVTIADLKNLSEDWLTRNFGTAGAAFYRLSRGIDSREVTPDDVAKSIGQEQTFAEDIEDPEAVRGYLLGEVEHVAYRLRKHRLTAKRVTLKIRFGDFETITRSRTLARPTDSTSILWETSSELYREWADSSFKPVRLIGATASQFEEDFQGELFPNETDGKKMAIDRGSDEIVNRFGLGAIRRGASIKQTRPHYTDRNRGDG